MENTVSSLLADTRLHLKRAESIAEPRSFSGKNRGFPMLAAGHIHEWFSTDSLNRRPVWFPPLTLLALLACSTSASGRILWIGRRCWPSFQLLCSCSNNETSQKILSCSTFLDPLTDGERFWAIAEGLRCSAVGSVVADGGGMSPTVSRRLQLAAETGRERGGMGLIARPPWEIDEPFCAGTRWHVQATDSCTEHPQWTVELQRGRGQQDMPRRWIVDWNYRVFVGTGTLHFSPDVGCGSATVGKSGRSKTA